MSGMGLLVAAEVSASVAEGDLGFLVADTAASASAFNLYTSFSGTIVMGTMNQFVSKHQHSTRRPAWADELYSIFVTILLIFFYVIACSLDQNASQQPKLYRLAYIYVRAKGSAYIDI